MNGVQVKSKKTTYILLISKSKQDKKVTGGTKLKKKNIGID